MKKKILITGGSGFIGINLIKTLNKTKKYKIVSTYYKSKNFFKVKGVKYFKVNLENPKQCIKITKGIDIVVMCAANSSGAAIMEKTPLVHLTPNIRMNLNMLEAAHQRLVKKFIFISSNTVYPLSNRAMREKDAKFDFFEKYHIVGWMKRFSEIVCDIYSNKIKKKMTTIIVRPGNLYGPHDKFDPQKSKVIPSLIRKVTSKKKLIEVWGDGKDLKDFLYIQDFCDALVKIIKNSKKSEILNIASGKSITIKEIIHLLLKIENKKDRKIFYDKSKPSMIPKRMIDISKIKKKYKFSVTTTIKQGLKNTVNWYKKNNNL